jgi:hypothetical protein
MLSMRHRLNMKLDLQSLFGLLCTAVLIGCDLATPPFPRIWVQSYTRAPLVSQDGRHLFVTPWYAYMRMVSLSKDILGACSVKFLIKSQSESSIKVEHKGTKS